MTDDNGPDHGVPCHCGAVHPDIESLRRHLFDARARMWLAENLGEPFVSYFDTIKADMGGMTPYDVAREGDDDRPMLKNVEDATVEWAHSSLDRPNRSALLDHAIEREGEPEDDRIALVEAIAEAWERSSLAQSQFATVLRDEADIYEEAPEMAADPQRSVGTSHTPEPE